MEAECVQPTIGAVWFYPRVYHSEGLDGIAILDGITTTADTIPEIKSQRPQTVP